MTYFQLVDRFTNEAIALGEIDKQICQLMNVQCHNRFYGGGQYNWFDSIGFALSTGKTLEDGPNSVRNYYQTNKLWCEELPWLEKIIDFLQVHYTCNSGYCHK